MKPKKTHYVDICPCCKEWTDYEWDEETEQYYTLCCGAEPYEVN